MHAAAADPPTYMSATPGELPILPGERDQALTRQ
jgi:hypothetical protein